MLTPSLFRLPPEICQFCKQGIPVVSLDFYDALFYGTAGTAFFFEPAAQFLEFQGVEGEAGDKGYTASSATLCFPTNADDPVSLGGGLVALAAADIGSLSAVGADSAFVGSIDQS